MSEHELQSFLQTLNSEIAVNAAVNENFASQQFTVQVAELLEGLGAIEDFQLCQWADGRNSIRLDGYALNLEEGHVTFVISDYNGRSTVETLKGDDIKSFFKKLESFVFGCIDGSIIKKLDMMALPAGLARDLHSRVSNINKVSLMLFSERMAGLRAIELPDQKIDGRTFVYDVWDLGRIFRNQGTTEQEQIEIEFENPLPCLLATDGELAYKSYLLAIPAQKLADIYDRYRARLLEQNVRSFLQARGDVNRGIRDTIRQEPDRFFAYNNGVTATATHVSVINVNGMPCIDRIAGLQVVNGGQTTASLFHTRRGFKDANLERIRVQLKLIEVGSTLAEELISNVSRYANTQNKVSGADLFANHPFHIKIENFSRTKLFRAPNSTRDSKWFYERARGQYADAQTTLTDAEKRRFQLEYPASQKFSKTDLAKFDNVWDDSPVTVNLGAQKNFASYAKRLEELWKEGNGAWGHEGDKISEEYFYRLIARAIIFKTLEEDVPKQSWYQQGYRANIVAYTIGLLSEYCRVYPGKPMAIDYSMIWKSQQVPQKLREALASLSGLVWEVISNPPANATRNLSEWAKKPACWNLIKSHAGSLIAEGYIPEGFEDVLITAKEETARLSEGKKQQALENNIQTVIEATRLGPQFWKTLSQSSKIKGLHSSPAEEGILERASSKPHTLSDKQCILLFRYLEKAKDIGVVDSQNVFL